MGEERHRERKVSCPRTQTQCPRPGLEPRPLDSETSALTMRRSRLHFLPTYVLDVKLTTSVVLFILTALSLTVDSSCVLQKQNSLSGVIRPSQSSQYSDNMSCRWNFSTNARVELAFFRFDTETSADFVNVYDGGSSSSPLIGRLSGSFLPATIISSLGGLYVTFASDSSGTYGGFVAAYRGMIYFPTSKRKLFAPNFIENC